MSYYDTPEYANKCRAQIREQVKDLGDFLFIADKPDPNAPMLLLSRRRVRVFWKDVLIASRLFLHFDVKFGHAYEWARQTAINWPKSMQYAIGTIEYISPYVQSVSSVDEFPTQSPPESQSPAPGPAPHTPE